jgi:hypothetical protein
VRRVLRAAGGGGADGDWIGFYPLAKSREARSYPEVDLLAQVRPFPSPPLLMTACLLTAAACVPARQYQHREGAETALAVCVLVCVRARVRVLACVRACVTRGNGRSGAGVCM